MTEVGAMKHFPWCVKPGEGKDRCAVQPDGFMSTPTNSTGARSRSDENHVDGKAAQVARLAVLMERYQAADADAADELILVLSPILARYFHSLIDTPRQVDDLLQECWLRIHRARHSYRPAEPVLPWVLSIARHTRVDYFRKWQRSNGREASIDAMVHDPSTDPSIGLEQHLEAGRILDAVKQLPESQREVLMMMKVADMSVEEVARATGLTSAAVKQKAYRAYQSLRKILGRNGVTEKRR